MSKVSWNKKQTIKPHKICIDYLKLICKKQKQKKHSCLCHITEEERKLMGFFFFFLEIIRHFHTLFRPNWWTSGLKATLVNSVFQWETFTPLFCWRSFCRTLVLFSDISILLRLGCRTLYSPVRKQEKEKKCKWPPPLKSFIFFKEREIALSLSGHFAIQTTGKFLSQEHFSGSWGYFIVATLVHLMLILLTTKQLKLINSSLCYWTGYINIPEVYLTSSD